MGLRIEARRDASARARARSRITLAHEPLECLQYRRARDAEIVGERARGWQPRAGRKAAVENRAAKGRIQLPMHGLAAFALEREVGRESIGDAGSGHG